MLSLVVARKGIPGDDSEGRVFKQTNIVHRQDTNAIELASAERVVQEEELFEEIRSRSRSLACEERSVVV